MTAEEFIQPVLDDMGIDADLDSWVPVSLGIGSSTGSVGIYTNGDLSFEQAWDFAEELNERVEVRVDGAGKPPDADFFLHYNWG